MIKDKLSIKQKLHEIRIDSLNAIYEEKYHNTTVTSRTYENPHSDGERQIMPNCATISPRMRSQPHYLPMWGHCGDTYSAHGQIQQVGLSRLSYPWADVPNYKTHRNSRRLLNACS